MRYTPKRMVFQYYVERSVGCNDPYLVSLVLLSLHLIIVLMCTVTHAQQLYNEAYGINAVPSLTVGQKMFTNS